MRTPHADVFDDLGITRKGIVMNQHYNHGDIIANFLHKLF